MYKEAAAIAEKLITRMQFLLHIRGYLDLCDRSENFRVMQHLFAHMEVTIWLQHEVCKPIQQVSLLKMPLQLLQDCDSQNGLKGPCRSTGDSFNSSKDYN